MKKQYNHVTPPVRNSIFSSLPGAKMAALEASIPPPPPPIRINMCSTVMHFVPIKHISFIAEALIAYDPRRDAIIKFISLFIPAHDGQTKGKWFKITAQNAPLPPIPVEGDPTHKPAWLEMEKMPVKPEGLEFRILRCYFNNKRPGSPMFEILNFDLPEDGECMVNRKTLRVEQTYNSVPLFCLRENWWHLLILKYLGRFVGAELITSTDTKAALQRLVAAGGITAATMEEILSEADDAQEEEEQILPTVRTVTPPVAPDSTIKEIVQESNNPPQTGNTRHEEGEEWKELGATSPEEYTQFLQEEGEVEVHVPANPHVAAVNDEEDTVLLMDE